MIDQSRENTETRFPKSGFEIWILSSEHLSRDMKTPVDMARSKDWLSTVSNKLTRRTYKSEIRFEGFHQKSIKSLFRKKDFKRNADEGASQNKWKNRPSACDFLRETLQRIRYILYGSGPLDVLGITFIAVMGSMPNSLRRRFRLADRLVGLCRKWMVARVVMRVFGVKYKLSDMESPKIILPQFESWMWNYLKPREGEVFVDVGAHVGKYTCMIAKMMCQRGFVIAIEPHPANFSVLVENIKMNHLNNVWASNIAAYNVDGKLPMFVGDMSGHHSLVTDMGCGTIQITARRLDDVIFDRVDRVDWVKIDVEGAELEVLKGMTKVLQRYRPSLIIELWKRNETGVVLLLNNAGYKIWTINEEPDSDSKHIFARKSRLESTNRSTPFNPSSEVPTEGMSRFCESALREAIEKLKSPKTEPYGPGSADLSPSSGSLFGTPF